MKKIISLTLLLTILLCSCGKTDEALPSPAPIPPASEAVIPVPTPDPTLTPKPLVIEASSTADPMDILLNGKTTQYVTDEAVDPDDIDTILRAGMNAPSAVNSQPWHFTVVTNKELMEDLGDEVLKVREYKRLERFNIWNTQVAIIISATDNLVTDSFDCGLSCEAMSLTAQLLGYGTKILGHPNLVLNGDKLAEYKELFGIPDDHTSVAILIIGVPDETVDAVSEASVRAELDEKVNYVK